MIYNKIHVSHTRKLVMNQIAKKRSKALKKRIFNLLVFFLLPVLILSAGAQNEDAGTVAEASAVRKQAGSIVASEGGVIAGLVPIEFNEAPMLKAMVASGELPPVEERLPDEPLVVRPFESIGKYGGTITLIQRTVSDWGTIQNSNLEPLLHKEQDNYTNAIPNLAVDWEMAADARTFTLFLRKGVKYSDGVEFTADDIMFWYNDQFMNEELAQSWRSQWRPMTAEKIDDYTLRYTFPEPSPGVIHAFASGTWWGSQSMAFQPAHYAKQFHIDYNEDAADLAKAEGFDHWYQLFQNKTSFNRGSVMNKELPVVAPWQVEEIEPDHVTMVRNPYYFKVDTEGNQLPYADYKRSILAENVELRAAKILAGEPDFTRGAISVKKIPAVKMVEERNNYRVFLGSKLFDYSAEGTLFFNHTTEDPVIRELLNNVKFKQALSLAINRDEINNTVMMGTAEPTQATLGPEPVTPFYEERFATAFIEYDPDRAMRLLDEIGLAKDSNGYRLRSDGDQLVLIIEGAEWIASHPPTIELVADYWDKIGIRTTANVNPGGGMWQKFSANTSHVSTWVFGSTYPRMSVNVQWWAQAQFWGRQWQAWFQSNGESGEEPTDEVKEFAAVWSDLPLTVDEAERIEMGKMAMELLAENLWFIGITTPEPEVRTVRRNLRNVNLEAFTETHLFVDRMFQWYFE